MNLDTCIAERYSCRSYSPYTPTDNDVDAILEAARLAPSACNRQPWRFMVVRAADTARREAILKAYPREWIATANTFIVVCGVTADAWVRPHDGRQHLLIDLGITTEHMCLKATELGLATCWICNFDPASLTVDLNLPQGIVPAVILPVGKPAEGSAIPAKNRRSIDELIIR